MRKIIRHTTHYRPLAQLGVLRGLLHPPPPNKIHFLKNIVVIIMYIKKNNCLFAFMVSAIHNIYFIHYIVLFCNVLINNKF